MKIERFGRYELKYFLPYDRIDDLLAWTRPYVTPDINAKCEEKGRPFYVVQSVYMDSVALRLYGEKVDGMRDRRKFRVRSYCVPGPDTSVSLEIKYRANTQVMKDRVFIPLKYADAVRNKEMPLGELALPLPKQKPAERFFYYSHLWDLVPITTVIYDRIPFTGREDENVRLTIDQNLRAADQRGASRLFENLTVEAVPLPGAILELKFDRLMPVWMRELVRHFDIYQESISKYCHCVDAIVFDQFVTI
ncbi:polyphosphate polymerase domain-containing protein [bacterium]|nr:polyphosphate polymerase domain-containing protein [bacterium]